MALARYGALSMGLALIGAAACQASADTRSAPAIVHVAPPADAAPSPTSAEAAPQADAGAQPAPQAEDPCGDPGPGRVRDDQVPRIRGGREKVGLLDWLAPRGVDKAAALSFLARTYGPGLTPEHAEAAFGSSLCRTLTVGDAREEALVCEHAVPTSVMQVHGVVLVVRGRKPVLVLDVGLGLQAMDWLDARHLDLALAIDDEGRAAELRDRAPEGTVLVEPRAACEAREARRAAGTLMPAPMTSAYPATMHGCDGARDNVRSIARSLASLPNSAPESRALVAFFDKGCGQRGRWVWRRDRFIHAP